MDTFDKILVCIDNTDIDSEILTAASLVSKLSESKEVHFIYVIKEINLPGSVLKEFPNIINDSINDRKKEIQRKVDQYFFNDDTKITLKVFPGSITKSILRYSAEMDADLIVMGRKNEVKGGGISINRIARRAACSLLILPSGYDPNLKKLLVPVDFSDGALVSLNQTLHLAEKSEQKIKVVAQNVYQVPSGYHYTGKSYKEFAKYMLEKVSKDFDKFLKKVKPTNITIKPIHTLDRFDNVIDQIYSTAKKIKAGGIVIGAKGRTKSTSLFISSKAERMIALDSELPLMVIRPKGESEKEGILEYLRKL
ncbi:universal stress protein [Reichenbachiella versicolor]|uniref:universal stress protein n=1 Tax=Reichenbachiella versicolor TaxID=1821036 RepID=UPI000D6EAEDC|nr:universal stress protein [Reichenbachiella versicolor]